MFFKGTYYMQLSIKRLAMAIMFEPDLEAAVEFYKKLGLKPAFHLKGRWAELMAGTVQIGLCPTDAQLPDRRTGLVFEVDNVQGLYNVFKDEITFVNEPTEALHGIMASIKDPGGNIIDLYQPTPEKVQANAQNADAASCCKGESADDACCKEQEEPASKKGCC